jgi:hypothetical protein
MFYYCMNSAIIVIVSRYIYQKTVNFHVMVTERIRNNNDHYLKVAVL